MLTKEHIIQIISPYLQEHQLFLVDCTMDFANNIQLEIDSFTGVTIDQCAKLNRYLNNALDKDTLDISVMVSSPGMGRPFKVKEQFLKNIDKKIEIKTKDGKTHAGVLKQYNEHEVVLEYTEVIKEKKKKIQQIKQIVFPLQDIKEVKKIITFKK